jgi:nitrogen fixation/metabolism regulation signal transduction histidine kinase
VLRKNKGLEDRRCSHDVYLPFPYSESTIEKGNVMSTITHLVQKATSSRRTLATVLAIIFLSIVLVTIYIEIMTAQMIAPPGLRVLDFFWRAFLWLKG